jgi:hypothetical protein
MRGGDDGGKKKVVVVLKEWGVSDKNNYNI